MVNSIFNLTENDIQGLVISETKAKDNCFIHTESSKGIIYNEFILNENTKSKIVCKVSFYRHANTRRYIPRLIFRKVNSKFEQSPVKKDIIIDLNKSEIASRFWILINFLKSYKDLVDCGDFERSYKVVKKDFIAEFKTKTEKDKIIEISKIIEESNLTTKDIVNSITLQERQKNIDAFEGFLTNKSNNGKNYFELYKEKYKIAQQGEESVWHHFLRENDWIVGLNIDIKFISDLVSEQKVGIENSQGKYSPKVDLLGTISNFTVLIELKTSNTKIFTNSKGTTSRTNTWSFTSEFIDGISQCLGQKFSFDKSYDNKDFIDESGSLIDKRILRTLDPKIIFIIGNRKKEFPLNNTPESIVKNETFERFRRNNKHVEIITFDELYERAKHIINQSDKSINKDNLNG